MASAEFTSGLAAPGEIIVSYILLPLPLCYLAFPNPQGMTFKMNSVKINISLTGLLNLFKLAWGEVGITKKYWVVGLFWSTPDSLPMLSPLDGWM